jgi:hypothetical protein
VLGQIDDGAARHDPDDRLHDNEAMLLADSQWIIDKPG